MWSRVHSGWRTRGRSLRGALAVVGLGGACHQAPSAELAPSASALASVAPPVATARQLAVQTAGSRVSFVMSAPIEQITGEVLDATEGRLFVDLRHLERLSGLLRVDLLALTLYRQAREEPGATLGEREKSELQNRHARTWLQISEDAPDAEREANRWAEYRIDKVLAVSERDVLALPGPRRVVTAKVEGDFRLHQRVTRLQAEVEAAFSFEGETLGAVTIETTAPLVVQLEEHDVRPRELFGKLAQKTLSDLGQKVVKQAPIELALTLKPQ